MCRSAMEGLEKGQAVIRRVSGMGKEKARWRELTPSTGSETCWLPKCSGLLTAGWIRRSGSGSSISPGMPTVAPLWRPTANSWSRSPEVQGCLSKQQRRNSAPTIKPPGRTPRRPLSRPALRLKGGAYFLPRDKTFKAYPPRSRKVEAIEVHHLGPGRDKVLGKLRLRVRTSIDFRQGPELGV